MSADPVPRSLKFRDQILSLAFGDTTRNTLLVGAGYGAQALASLATTVLVSRILGPGHFGIFSVALGAATTVAPIADFGLDAAFLRETSRAHATDDRVGLARLLRAYSQWKVVVFSVVGGGAAALAGWAAHHLMHYDQVSLLRMACLGAIGLNLMKLGRGLLEARGRFKDVALLTAGTAFLRLVLVAALIFASSMTPANVLIVYLAVPALGIVYALARSKDIPIFLSCPEGVAAERNQLRKFGAWVGGATVIMSLTGYIDTLLLNRWCGSAAVGQYSAAYKLAFSLITASFPIASVLLPRASAFQNAKRVEAFLKKARLLVVFGAAGAGALWLVAPLAVHFLLGPAYAPSAGLLRVLALGTGFMFAGGPYSMTFYSSGDSRPIAVAALAQFAVLVPTLMLLIPRMGAEGAAWAFTVAHAFNFFFLAALARRAISRMRRTEVAAARA